MKDPIALPLALAQANYGLQARIAEAAQSGGQHWYDLVQRLVSDGIVEGSTELQDLLHSQDWHKLMSMPTDAYWRQLQQRFGDQQAATQIAVAAQTSFALGLQDALAAWQRETIAALDQAGLATPALDPGWAQLFAGWGPTPPGAANPPPPAPEAAQARAKSAPAKAPTKAPVRTSAKTSAKTPASKTPASKGKPGKAAGKTPAKKAPAKKA